MPNQYLIPNEHVHSSIIIRIIHSCVVGTKRKADEVLQSNRTGYSSVSLAGTEDSGYTLSCASLEEDCNEVPQAKQTGYAGLVQTKRKAEDCGEVLQDTQSGYAGSVGTKRKREDCAEVPRTKRSMFSSDLGGTKRKAEDHTEAPPTGYSTFSRKMMVSWICRPLIRWKMGLAIYVRRSAHDGRFIHYCRHQWVIYLERELENMKLV